MLHTSDGEVDELVFSHCNKCNQAIDLQVTERFIGPCAHSRLINVPHQPSQATLHTYNLPVINNDVTIVLKQAYRMDSNKQ